MRRVRSVHWLGRAIGKFKTGEPDYIYLNFYPQEGMVLITANGYLDAYDIYGWDKNYSVCECGRCK